MTQFLKIKKEPAIFFMVGWEVLRLHKQTPTIIEGFHRFLNIFDRDIKRIGCTVIVYRFSLLNSVIR